VPTKIVLQWKLILMQFFYFRLLHSLGYVVKCNTSSYKTTEILNEGHNTHQQSVLELASVIHCLAHDLAVQIQNTFDSSSIPAEALNLTEEKQTVEPTPAEKLAIQVSMSFSFIPLFV
jgi:hypothetical protein